MNNSHSGEFRLPPEVIDGINRIERERREINPENIDYEGQMFFVIVKILGITFLFLVLSAVSSGFFTSFGFFSGFLGLLGAATGIGGLFYVFSLISKQQEQSIKMQRHHSVYLQDVMLPLLRHLNPQFTYHRHGSIFDDNKAIFKERFAITSIHKAEDLVEGEIDGISIRFGEVEKLDEDNQYKKFLCFVADFNKHLNAATILTPNVMISIRHAFSLKHKGLKKIRLDNPTMNQKFMVHTDNEIEARYVLTPRFMEQILAANQPGYYLFQDNKMLFLGNVSVDLFDIDADTDIYEQTLQTGKVLKQLLGLVEVFNLNSRIWK